MIIQAGATLIQKNCDIIEDGGVKIVKNYGTEEKKNKKPLTEEELKEKITFVRPKIGDRHRLWFPVCKYMMWNKMVSDGDFDSAVAIISRIMPEEASNLNAKDLSSLNVLCFAKELEEWKDADAPVHGSTYNKYYVIAELMDSI